MLFSTRAEYGVRLLVELGRQSGDTPVSLAAIALADDLPLGYLEQLAPRLKRAGLVLSTRGSHGGYRLARDPGAIAMDEVVIALEGAVTPMECFIEDADGGPSKGRVMCPHVDDHGRACATKLLWARVQGEVSKALARTTLAELIEFSAAAESSSLHRPPAVSKACEPAAA